MTNQLSPTTIEFSHLEQDSGVRPIRPLTTDLFIGDAALHPTASAPPDDPAETAGNAPEPITVAAESVAEETAADPATPAVPSLTLDMLRTCASCPPFSSTEFRAANQYGQEVAVPHLVATTLLHCAGITETIVDYRTSAALRADLDKEKRQKARRALEEELAKLQPAADQYATTLAAVREHTVSFEKRYMPYGKINRAALAELYDRTDPLEHPAIAVLEALRPPPNADMSTGTQPALQQSMAISAERLLRHILDQAHNESSLQ